MLKKLKTDSLEMHAQCTRSCQHYWSLVYFDVFGWGARALRLGKESIGLLLNCICELLGTAAVFLRTGVDFPTDSWGRTTF